MKEMRSLSFTEREAIMAIVDLMRKMRAPLPVGQVVGLQLTEDPVGAELIIEDDDGERTHVPRTAPELAASLVNYCLERKIRLPSSSRKFVEVIGGNLNLIVYLDETDLSAPPKKPAPSRNRA